MLMLQDAPLYCTYLLVRMLLSYSRPVSLYLCVSRTVVTSFHLYSVTDFFLFVFRDRFQQSVILCGIFPVISTVKSYSFMFVTNSQNCVHRGYYAANSDDDKEFYHYSLRNNPEGCSSQLLCGGSVDSCIVNSS